MSSDGGRGHGKTPNYVVKPLLAFRYKVGRKAETDLYDACHLAWRAGVIDGFYFGRRSPQDPTIVWELNGQEVAPELIPKHLETARIMAGVVSVVWGEWWCGFRGLVVTFSSGVVVHQHWDQGVREEVAS